MREKKNEKIICILVTVINIYVFMNSSWMNVNMIHYLKVQVVLRHLINIIMLNTSYFFILTTESHITVAHKTHFWIFNKMRPVTSEVLTGLLKQSPSLHLIHLPGCGSFHKHGTARALRQSLSEKTNFLRSENIHVLVVSFFFHLYCIYMQAGTLRGVSNFTRQIKGTGRAKLAFALYAFKLYMYLTHSV